MSSGKCIDDILKLITIYIYKKNENGIKTINEYKNIADQY